MGYVLGLIVLGLVGGIASGLIGIGGGVILVPALVFLFGMGQHHAQGTSMALMVPPIGILGAWTYWRDGYVDLKVAALLCLGFVVGSLLGARLATSLSSQMLERVFGVALLIIGAKMLFGR
jgi:uncharacterized protein